MIKSAVFGVMHIAVAFSLSYLLTGSVAVAGAITLVEPLANTVVHYLFDRWWERRAATRQSVQRGAGPAAAPPAPAS